jgi:hypothetical protein
VDQAITGVCNPRTPMQQTTAPRRPRPQLPRGGPSSWQRRQQSHSRQVCTRMALTCPSGHLSWSHGCWLAGLAAWLQVCANSRRHAALPLSGHVACCASIRPDLDSRPPNPIQMKQQRGLHSQGQQCQSCIQLGVNWPGRATCSGLLRQENHTRSCHGGPQAAGASVHPHGTGDLPLQPVRPQIIPMQQAT